LGKHKEEIGMRRNWEGSTNKILGRTKKKLGSTKKKLCSTKKICPVRHLQLP
jgi:hypothetical protein